MAQDRRPACLGLGPFGVVPPPPLPLFPTVPGSWPACGASSSAGLATTTARLLSVALSPLQSPGLAHKLMLAGTMRCEPLSLRASEDAPPSPEGLRAG